MAHPSCRSPPACRAALSRPCTQNLAIGSPGSVSPCSLPCLSACSLPESLVGSATRRDALRLAGGAVPGTVTLPRPFAHAAVFLMTNPQVTGTVLEVTGGETLINTLE